MSQLELSIDEYIEQFNEKAEELSNTKLSDAPDVTVIIAQVDEMIEEYFRVVGYMPAPYTLNKLADYILVNELKDKGVDKVSNTEYPILSDIQLRRRARKQFTAQDTTLDFLNTKFNKQVDSLARKSVKKAEY